MIKEEDIETAKKAAVLTGFHHESINDIRLITWQAGKKHIPEKLPKGYGAIYIFMNKDICLKVGRVGPNSNPRYQHQHYRVSSNVSTFGKSIVQDMSNDVNKDNVASWIKENTTRYNILIPEELGSRFRAFIEAFFILKLNPIYEGRKRVINEA